MDAAQGLEEAEHSHESDVRKDDARRPCEGPHRHEIRPGFAVWVQGEGVGCRVPDVGCGVWGLGCRINGVGCGV